MFCFTGLKPDQVSAQTTDIVYLLNAPHHFSHIFVLREVNPSISQGNLENYFKNDTSASLEA